MSFPNTQEKKTCHTEISTRRRVGYVVRPSFAIGNGFHMDVLAPPVLF